MSEMTVLYVFIGLMALNFFASLLYIVGLNQLKSSAARVFRSSTPKPR